jgi:hypothetical protein
MTLTEVVTATALAGVLLGVHGSELNRQRVELSVLNEESLVRDELLTAYERLRAGALAAPERVGERTTIDVSGGTRLSTLRLSIERLPATSGLSPRVVPVRLRADWRSSDGGRRHRKLSTLTPTRGAQ